MFLQFHLATIRHMSPLLVIAGLPDLPPASHAELPAWPALDELLRLGDCANASRDWRSGMLGDLGVDALGAEAPAVIAAAALQLPAGAAVCLAAPVHAVAGLSRVHLHAAGLLQLDAQQGEEFAAAFAAQFGDELRLHPLAGGWLLEGACAAAARDEDPQDLLGMPLERSAARSDEERQLRRLGAEIEMWLAALPLNEKRRRRGELPANLLWLWGGGRVGAGTSLHPRPPLRLQAHGADPWLAGCAALFGATVEPLAQGWPQPRTGNTRVDSVVREVIVLHAGGVDGAHLRRWDEEWFAPLLNDLRAQRIEALTLRLGRRAWRVHRRLWSAPWRRRQSWWQAVGT
jgi:hypothetical protein